MSGSDESNVGRVCRQMAVPVLLVVIALFQHHRARTIGQSSWIGCGFGMFATLDNHISRFVLPRLATDTRQVSPILESSLNRVKVIPTQKNLDRLRDEVVGLNRDASPGRLALYKIAFDPEENILSASMILESSEP